MRSTSLDPGRIGRGGHGLRHGGARGLSERVHREGLHLGQRRTLPGLMTRTTTASYPERDHRRRGCREPCRGQGRRRLTRRDGPGSGGRRVAQLLGVRRCQHREYVFDAGQRDDQHPDHIGRSRQADLPVQHQPDRRRTGQCRSRRGNRRHLRGRHGRHGRRRTTAATGVDSSPPMAA